MRVAKTAKPATAQHGEPASKFEQLGGQLDSENSLYTAELQARRLSRLYALSYATAATIAQLAFAAGCPR